MSGARDCLAVMLAVVVFLVVRLSVGFYNLQRTVLNINYYQSMEKQFQYHLGRSDTVRLYLKLGKPVFEQITAHGVDHVRSLGYTEKTIDYLQRYAEVRELRRFKEQHTGCQPKETPVV